MCLRACQVFAVCSHDPAGPEGDQGRAPGAGYDPLPVGALQGGCRPLPAPDQHLHGSQTGNAPSITHGRTHVHTSALH